MSTLSLGSPGTIHPARSTRARTTDTRPAADRPRLRLTRRGRLALFGVTLMLALGAFVTFGPSVVATGQAGDPVATTTVTVQPGQTMWDIAGRANPSGDIRDTVHEIAELNSLPSAGELEVGEELAVPQY